MTLDALQNSTRSGEIDHGRSPATTDGDHGARFQLLTTSQGDTRTERIDLPGLELKSSPRGGTPSSQGKEGRVCIIVGSDIGGRCRRVHGLARLIMAKSMPMDYTFFAAALAALSLATSLQLPICHLDIHPHSRQEMLVRLRAQMQETTWSDSADFVPSMLLRPGRA